MPIQFPMTAGGAGFDPNGVWFAYGWATQVQARLMAIKPGTSEVVIIDGTNAASKVAYYSPRIGVYTERVQGTLTVTGAPADIAIAADGDFFYIGSGANTAAVVARSAVGDVYTPFAVATLGASGNCRALIASPFSGTLIGAWSTTGFYFRSTDQAATWSPIVSAGLVGPLNGGQPTATPGGFIFPAANGGAMAVSFDDGVTWQAPSVPPTTDNRGIAYYDASAGVTYFCTLLAETFISDDEGDTWSVLPDNPLQQRNAIQPTPLTPCAILRLNDGGIYFFPQSLQIIRTFDRGQSWDILPVFTTGNIGAPTDAINQLALVNQVYQRGGEVVFAANSQYTINGNAAAFRGF